MLINDIIVFLVILYPLSYLNIRKPTKLGLFIFVPLFFLKQAVYPMGGLNSPPQVQQLSVLPTEPAKHRIKELTLQR